MESDFSRFSKLKDICEVEISQELCPAEKEKRVHQADWQQHRPQGW